MIFPKWHESTQPNFRSTNIHFLEEQIRGWKWVTTSISTWLESSGLEVRSLPLAAELSQVHYLTKCAFLTLSILCQHIAYLFPSLSPNSCISMDATFVQAWHVFFAQGPPGPITLNRIFSVGYTKHKHIH
jgi:hypothetical protein